MTALENAVVSFELSVSHDTVPVRWFHKNVELKQSDKYKMISQRKVHKLMLHNISPADAGEYTAFVGQLECKAKLFVESKYHKLVRKYMSCNTNSHKTDLSLCRLLSFFFFFLSPAHIQTF